MRPGAQKTTLQLGFVLLFYALFLAVPIGFIVFYAAADQAGSFSASLGLLLTDRLYAAVLLNTIYISVLVMVSTLLVAYPVVYFLAHSPRKWKRIVLLMITSSMWVNVLVRNFSWMELLGRNSPLRKVLVFLHLIGEDASLLFSRFAVVAGMANILLPIMIFCIYSAIPKSINELKKVSRSMDATDWFYFIKVFLPESLRGALAGSLLVFLLSLSYYITPALLGGGHRETMMVSMLIEQQINQMGNWPMGAILSLALIAIVFLALAVGLWPKPVRRYLSVLLTNRSHVK